MVTRTTFVPAQTGFSRVQLIEGRARFDHIPSYQSNMKAGGPSQSFGDVDKIEVPSPSEFGKFIEVGTIRGETERVSVTLTGRYAADLKSELLRLARRQCALDVQINLGACTDPSNNNVYTKKIVIENAFLTSYETEDLGALGSDERAKVDESVEVSGRDIYETTPTSYASRGGDVVTNEVVAGIICGDPSCGDCTTESDGCNKMFSITLGAGGSPTTPADVVFSLDKGQTFQAHDIDSMGAADNPDGVACLGDNLVVVSEDTESLHYAPLADFDGSSDPTFTEVSTGFVAGAGPRAVYSTGSVLFIVGASGYIYSTADPTAGVTVLDAGVVHVDSYNAVHALSDEFAIAVGNSGIIAKTENGSTWASVASPVGAGVHLNTVFVKNKNEWVIGTNGTGQLYYTLDGGDTWTEKTFSGSGSGSVESVHFGNDTIGYMSHTLAGVGRILKTIDGGYSWVLEQQSTGSIPANDRINTVFSCPHNPDVVFAVGLADDASDGFILVGTD